MIITVIPGKFGSMAGKGESGNISYSSMPASPKKFKQLINIWTGSEELTIYIDEFYMMNTPRLDFSKIDMAEYSYYIGVMKGVSYALASNVVPCDTAEILFHKSTTAAGYISGLDVDSKSFDIASKAYPDIKREIELKCDIFYSLAPALALLYKVTTVKQWSPTKMESTKEKFPESFIV